jgi:Ion channel
MRILAFIAGLSCLGIVLLDAFQTIILPRRATGRFRLTRIFYILTWRPWSFFTRMLRSPRTRETIFSYYGPLSLIVLLVVWASLLVLGFGLLYYASGSPFNDVLETKAGIYSDLYVSGTTLFTLGIGDEVPKVPWVRWLLILQAGLGLGFLAEVIGYFPVLYGAFSRREVSIAMLDARAGSPPTAGELLRRHTYKGADQALIALLMEWERWSAELLESHISYPLLCYFRSQHTDQSWLSALTAVLDASALMIAGVQAQDARQAQLTFAMARHALVDISQILSLKPLNGAPDRLPPERYERLFKALCESGVSVCQDGHSLERLAELRVLYEGYAETLSRYLSMPLPPWIAERPRKDDWQRVAKSRGTTDVASALNAVTAEAERMSSNVDHRYDF